jgi:hypothetical protein
MTYAELTQQIQDYVQSDEATFLSNLDSIIQLAEQRINRDVKSPDSRSSITGSVTTQTITTPTDFVMPLSLFVNVGGLQTGLLLKEPSYLTEAYGVTEASAGSTGSPAYYAIQKSSNSNTTILVAPSADIPYTYTLYYYSTPDTITSGGSSATTWVSTYFPQVLLYGCLVEAYTFLKGDQQMQQQYEKLYQLGMLELKNVCEDEQRMDNFRNPDSKRNIG